MRKAGKRKCRYGVKAQSVLRFLNSLFPLSHLPDSGYHRTAMRLGYRSLDKGEKRRNTERLKVSLNLMDAHCNLEYRLRQQVKQGKAINQYLFEGKKDSIRLRPIIH